MKSIEQERPFFKQLFDMLETQMSCNDELVLHDLTKDYDHTIVDIRNGHVTDRRIGDCGSNLGLEVLRGTVENGDRYNYITNTRSGKILRSSTIFIHDDDGHVIGSLCINKDITESLKMEAYMRNVNKYTLPGQEHESAERSIKEAFFNNVNELLDYMIQDAQAQVNKPVAQMDRADKQAFLKYLDDKGAFVIAKSGERVCDFLGISKYTLYTYLDVVRNGGDKTKNRNHG